MWISQRPAAGCRVIMPEDITNARNPLLALLHGSVEDTAKLYDDFPVMAVLYGYGAMTEKQKLDAAIRCPETLLETLIHKLDPRQRNMAIINAPIFAALQVLPYLTKDEINLIFDIIYDQALYQVKSNISIICASLLIANLIKGRRKFAQVSKVVSVARENLMEFVRSRDLTDISGLPAYLADMKHFSSSRQHYMARTRLKPVQAVMADAEFGPISLLYTWEHYIPRGHIISEHKHTLIRLFNPFVFNACLGNMCDKTDLDPYHLANVAFKAPFAITGDMSVKVGRALLQTDIYPRFRDYMKYSLSSEEVNKLDSLFVVSSVDKVFSGTDR